MLFYGVYDKTENLMYIGTTTQSIEERMVQHYKDKATDQFHEWLRTVSKDDIVVKSMCGDAMAFDCWGDVEDFEMELVQKHEPLLNTRKHTQRQEIIEIKTPELETMTKEEYDAIKYYKKEEKEIKPHFETIESKKTIRLRFNHNRKRFENSKGYDTIGHDKAKQFLEASFYSTVEELKQQSNKPVEINEEEDDGKIWITFFLNTSF